MKSTQLRNELKSPRKVEQSSLRLYRADAGNVKKIVDLINADSTTLFYNAGFLSWKYQENPAGEPHVYFAEDRRTGMICGAYNVIAWNMLIGGKKVRCAQSVDTIVHPSHRGEGIFQQLFRFAADQLAAEYVPFILGFPNENAFSKFTRLGWINPARLESFATVLDVRRFLEENGGVTRRMAIRAGNYLLGCRNGKHWSRKGTGPFKISSLQSFQELPLMVDFSEDAQTWRDVGFMEWRYVKRPENSYEILKVTANGGPPMCFVLKGGRHSTEILDIVPCNDERQVEHGLAALCRHLKDRGLFSVRCASSGKLSKALRSVGFLRRNESAPLIIYHLTNEIDIGKIAAHRWLLRAGDIEAT